MTESNLSMRLVVPWHLGDRHVNGFIAGLQRQVRQPDFIEFIDSSPAGGRTAELLSGAGYPCVSIEPANFDHGATRNQGLNSGPPANITVFMSQDAYLRSPDALAVVDRRFAANARLGALLGRQVPRPGAPAAEEAMRLARFPDLAYVANHQTGYRKYYFSNAFSAYRTEALRQVGGFRESCDFGEDSFASFDLQQEGWDVVYEPSADVDHSHDGGVAQTHKRMKSMTTPIPSSNLSIVESLAVAGEELTVALRRRSPRMFGAVLLNYGARATGMIAARRS